MTLALDRAFNKGPSTASTVNTSAVYTAGGIVPVSTGGSAYGTTVSATLSASQDNLSPVGNVPGTTNRYILTPASGGSTILGLLASPTDGFTVLLVNPSTTDSLTFAHQSSGTPTNRFSCPNGVSAFVGPLANAFATYVVNQWVFA